MGIIEKMFGSSDKEKRPSEEKSRTERTFGKSEKKEKEEKPKKSLTVKANKARQTLKKAGAAGINIVGSFDGSKVKVSDSGKVTRIGKSGKVIKGQKKPKTPSKRASPFGDPKKGMYHSDMAKKVKSPSSPIGMSSLSGYSTKAFNKKLKL